MSILKNSQYALLVVLTALAALVISPDSSLAHEYDTTSKRFTFFAWRSLGYFSNDTPVVKYKCFLGSDGTPSAGQTGMAEYGWHELHPLPGPQTASLTDASDAYPSIAGPVVVGNKPEDWAVFDLPVYWTYETDILTSSPSVYVAGQTFVATGPGLDKVSLHQFSGPQDLSVTVYEGNPKGRQIGESADFQDQTPTDGIHPGWQVARWRPGDVPLTAGKVYYLRIASKSGKSFALRTHSTGNIYSGGTAWYEGVSDESSDLGLLISCERENMRRSPVLFTGRDNWARNTRGVYFRAASSNIRALYTHIKFRNAPYQVVAQYRVFRLLPNRTLVRVGVDKECYDYASPGNPHYMGVVYAADEIPLEKGRIYYLQVIPKGDGIPTDEKLLPRMDLNVTIYGESVSGMTPVIYDQHIAGKTKSDITVTWRGSNDADTHVRFGLDPLKLDQTVRVPRGVNAARIGPAVPGTTLAFRIVKKTSAGGIFETPVYEARTLDVNGAEVKDPSLKPAPEHTFLSQCIGFLNLADMRPTRQPPLPRVQIVRQIPLQNASFQDGLAGWTTGNSRDIKAVEAGEDGAAGWDLRFKQGGDNRTQERLQQTVSVTPGKSYMLKARLRTEQGGVSDNWYSRLQHGDLTAKLFFAADGTEELNGLNSTQAFRTDGQWLEFARVFRATSSSVNVGVAFSRTYNWSLCRGLADEVRLFEVLQTKAMGDM